MTLVFRPNCQNKTPPKKGEKQKLVKFLQVRRRQEVVRVKSVINVTTKQHTISSRQKMTIVLSETYRLTDRTDTTQTHTD